MPKIMGNLLRFYRDMLVYKNVGFLDDMSGLLKTEAFEKLAKAHSNKRLFFYVDNLRKALSAIKWSNNPWLHLELAIIKLTDDEPASEAKLIAELARLEERIVELEKAPAKRHPRKCRWLPETPPPSPTRSNQTSSQVASNPYRRRSFQRPPPPKRPSRKPIQTAEETSLFSGLFDCGQSAKPRPCKTFRAPTIQHSSRRC
ncbi:MAG: hypothetical protein MZU95_14375 [Desulfomicrobium escambiense]|nr:hypothetical protein [Desulfomicrobium escambiense]